MMGYPEERRKENIVKRPFIFLSKWRSLPFYELICYILMFASVPMLAYGIQTYDWDIIEIITLTILTLYSGFFAVLIWNDITDADIDAMIHPDRPIPSGRISSRKFFSIALVFSAMTFFFALLVNLWCFIFVGAAALYVTFHNKYLKRKVRIPAYSEIFTPPQWIIVPIFGFLAVSSIDFQNLIILAIFTYFADNAHDVAEGIHDLEGDRKYGVRTYSTSFGEKTAAKISFAMFFISGILGIILYIRTILSPIFLLPFLLIWVYTLYYSYKLITTEKEVMSKVGAIVGRRGFDFFLLSYNLIFLDILLQLINFHFKLIV